MRNTQTKCPICDKLADDRMRPFCSARCADIDLGRWFTGHYAVSAHPDDDEAGSPSDGTA